MIEKIVVPETTTSSMIFHKINLIYPTAVIYWHIPNFPGLYQILWDLPMELFLKRKGSFSISLTQVQSTFRRIRRCTNIHVINPLFEAQSTNTTSGFC